jgi:hypothetical protein
MEIAVGCVSLISAIRKTSVVITSFVRNCHAVRHDLDAVSRELTSLKTVVNLLKDDAEIISN